MKVPQQSYRIWFSQRNGSTLFCKGLEQTGIAGKPGEFFNVMEHETLCEKYDVSDYEALKTTIWELGTSDNGVFGIKHSMHTNRYAKIYDELKILQGIPKEPEVDEESLFADLFPNCKHIYLTRRNKIRQAVSWWKAIHDQQWHLAPDQSLSEAEDFYEKYYDFDALSHLFKEANLRECAIQAYFSKYNIVPLTFVYEDFIQDFQGSLQKAIDYLEIPYDSINLPEMYYKRTSNKGSEQWVQRFRKDFQAQMDQQIW